MATTAPSEKSEDRYFELVSRFPLRPIRSEAQLDAAIAMIDSLTSKGALDLGEEDYLEVLGNLVEQYEKEVFPIGPVSDSEMLSHLLDAKGVSQTEVSEATRIAISTLSEVLAGKRSLNRRHIAVLSRYFNVPPTVFAF